MRLIQTYVFNLIEFMKGGYMNIITAVGVSLVVVWGAKLLFIAQDEAVYVSGGIAYKRANRGMVTGWITTMAMLNLVAVLACALVACTRRVKEDYTTAYVEMRKATDASFSDILSNKEARQQTKDILAASDIPDAKKLVRDTASGKLNRKIEAEYTRAVVLLAN